MEKNNQPAQKRKQTNIQKNDDKKQTNKQCKKQKSSTCVTQQAWHTNKNNNVATFHISKGTHVPMGPCSTGDSKN